MNNDLQKVQKEASGEKVPASHREHRCPIPG